MSSGQSGRDIINLTFASVSRAPSLSLLLLLLLLFLLLPLHSLSFRSVVCWVMCGFSCRLYIFKLLYENLLSFWLQKYVSSIASFGLN